MKDNILKMPSSMVLVRGVVRGMGRKADCDLLLRKEPLAGSGDRSGTKRYRYTQWTVLYAPYDLADGEYVITTEDHFSFAATRVHGLWLHGNAPEAAQIRSGETA
jgi:hypothetical protein